MRLISPNEIFGDKKFIIYRCFECGSQTKTPVIIPLDVTFDLYDRKIYTITSDESGWVSRYNEDSRKWETVPSTDKKLLHEVLSDMIKDWNHKNPSLPL